MRRVISSLPKHNTYALSNITANASVYVSCKSFSTSSARLTAWSPQPAPPRLPKEEQEIFDRLQRESAGPFSTPKVNQPQQSPSLSSSASAAESAATKQEQLIAEAKELAAVRNGEELHPNIRRGAPPEFEGDINPKTKESGGPKNEPLRWGGQGDWSYNGRVTDF